MPSRRNARSLVRRDGSSANGAPPPSEPAPLPAPAQGAPPQADLASSAVNTNVNLRRGPGTNYTTITLIPAGAGVQVGDCNGGWCQVTYQGQEAM
jgi:hypothetical protein